jgi:hypothetical protein
VSVIVVSSSRSSISRRIYREDGDRCNSNLLDEREKIFSMISEEKKIFFLTLSQGAKKSYIGRSMSISLLQRYYTVRYIAIG